MNPLVAPDAHEIRDALDQVAQFGILGTAHARLFDVGTQNFLAHFGAELLDNLILTGGSTCRFYEGGYGAGKTHLLRLLQELGVGRGMACVQTELSHTLPFENAQLITKSLLQHIMIVRDGQTVRGLPNILSTLREGGQSRIANLRKVFLPHAGFKRAMLLASELSTTSSNLSRYLLGERVSSALLQQDGYTGVKDPLVPRNAELVLETVTGGLFHLGIPGTMLLFDETERSLVSNANVTPTKVLLAANFLRRLIDACTTERLTGTIVVFAILPGFLENCARVYPALGQRLEMSRGPDARPAWRWPVLPVDALTAARMRDEFVREAAQRFVQLVGQCGRNAAGLEEQLVSEGLKVLNEHAGSGYRRFLMKRFATIAADRLEGM